MNIVKLLCITLSVSLGLSSLIVPLAHAQQGVFDINPPVIELDESNEGIAGETQVFTAQVTDDRALRDVKLYYRFTGQEAYIDLFMTRLGDTDFFSSNVNTNVNETRGIEYYIQARDEGGNRVIKGFAFDPFVRTLVPPGAEPEPETTDPAADPTTDTGQPTEPDSTVLSSNTDTAEPAQQRSGGISKWWYVVIGVLVAGAAVAAAGGDDGGSNNGQTTPINVTVDGT